jgi:regulatory factor X
MTTPRSVRRHTRGVHVDQSVIGQYLDGQSLNILNRTINFPNPQGETQAEDRVIDLPDIWKYLPPNTDPDLADALTALYRAHCISVIDNFRYCKEKMFFHHFNAFQGTLTLPVQKLLAEPTTAGWIKECDWLMYQKMVAFVGPLTTQVVPKAVLDVMKSISERLVSRIETTFRNQPRHVTLAKLIPASIFSRLLKRLLRVNASAHAAANILTNPANRQQMWEDWVGHVDAELVVESSVPIPGFLGTKDILKYEVRKLLLPLPNTSHLEFGTFYYDEDRSHEHDLLSFDSSVDSVAFPDRWVQFLSGLPNRFHCIADEPEKLVSFHNEVWQAALRDLTIGGAQSFGSWWIANVFVCEMLQWIVESGGFMSHSAGTTNRTGDDVDFMKSEEMMLFRGSPNSAGRSDRTTGSASERPVTGRTEESVSSSSETQNPQAKPGTGLKGDACRVNQHRLLNLSTSVDQKEHVPGHDDSGIGMGLDDDELPAGMDKYGAEMAMLKSDPADAEGDVVVCR